MRIFKQLTFFSTNRPRVVMWITAVSFVIFALQFPNIKIDTDPENMLSEDEFARVFHHEVKEEFGLYDFIVLGIVNSSSRYGVFNPATLKKILDLTEKIKKMDGVISYELISLSTKDNIRQAGPGMVLFEWLMKEAPKTKAEALLVRDEAKDNPMLDGTIVSENGKVACIYIPIEKKDMSYRISNEIMGCIEEMPDGNEKYYITGLPVAEDTFGFEMFKQMAMSAPLAGLLIFILMLLFFKKIQLVISPMLVAMASIVFSMGLLIAGGFTVHIMSSMIPIFLMPIAVVDSVHILSEFFDRFPGIKDKKITVHAVMDELFMPMLYTSLTSAAGFASLAFTPIPPVRVFGLFVAFGILIAWMLTITFIPAYIMMIKPASLSNYGRMDGKEHYGVLDRLLVKAGLYSAKYWKAAVISTLCVLVISIYGITKIRINDNPVKWFTKDHKIRVADKILNENFGGTYTAYFVLDAGEGGNGAFKDPALLRWVESLQAHLLNKGLVGKSTSIVDVVKKVFYELLGGDKINNRVPGSRQAVAQCLLSFENSHKPDDLWHLVTTDYNKANIWLQLKSGDNQDMDKALAAVDEYLRSTPPPVKIKTGWAGLTYINTVWQEKMVRGMFRSLMGAFIIVFLMMVILFRSVIWGGLCMIPLSVTILLIYGIIGLIGKDYDMPVAVLSSLTLGLSVDFAIHFLQRARDLFKIHGNWERTRAALFGEPARAITRNAIVISIGFTPLFIASLVPYQTVGIFLTSIMAVSCIATLVILTAILGGLHKFILRYSIKGRQ